MTQANDAQQEIESVNQKFSVKTKYLNACRDIDTAYAIKNLGEMVRSAQDNAGFEALESRHWVSIGIAIERLADALYEGPLHDMLKQAEEAYSAESNTH